MFNYNHLYYFYVTAKLGGVTKASKALRVAQPALSSQIKTLESQLKRRLFQKSGRNLVLTSDGRRAFAYCQRAFEATEEFSDYLKHSDKEVRQRLKIGVSPEIERPFLADALSVVLREGRGRVPLVSMQSASSAILLEKLKTRELDAALVGKPLYSSDVKTLNEIQMPVIAVTTRRIVKNLGSNRKELVSTLLKNHPDVGLVLPSETLRLRLETDLYLQKNKIRSPVFFESDVLAAVVRATLDGVGVAFLPLAYIRAELNRERLVAIGTPQSLWKHSVYFVASAVCADLPPIKAIKEHFDSISRESKIII